MPAGLTLLSAEDPFGALVLAIWKGEFEETPCSITLKDEGLTWFFDNFRSLFIRPFYKDLLMGEEAVRNFSPIKFHKFVVLGNPGIGKSSFGLYVLFRAIRLGRSVVYLSGKKPNWGFVVVNGVPHRFNLSSEPMLIYHLLEKKETVFISDTMDRTTQCAAVTFLITSPKRSRWFEFAKDKQQCVELLFPTFGEGELADMCRSCFQSVTEDSVGQRFLQWGGIPRFVFSQLSDEKNESEFAGAIQKVDIDHLTKLSSIEIEMACEESHRVLHFVPRGALTGCEVRPSSLAYFEYAKLMICSEKAEQMLFLRKITEDADSIRKLIAATSDVPALSIIRGNAFGYLASAILSCGGTFAFRNLSDKSEADGELVLRPSDLILFSNILDLGQKVDRARNGGTLGSVLLHAARKNECAVDACLPDRRLANYTVASKHALTLASATKRKKGVAAAEAGDDSSGDDADDRVEVVGLEAVAAALGYAPSDTIPFFFVVPSDKYRAGMKRAQSLYRLGKLVTKDPKDPISSRVIQYVLKIDIETHFSIPLAVAQKIFSLGTR